MFLSRSYLYLDLKITEQANKHKIRLLRIFLPCPGKVNSENGRKPYFTFVRLSPGLKEMWCAVTTQANCFSYLPRHVINFFTSDEDTCKRYLSQLFVTKSSIPCECESGCSEESSRKFEHSTQRYVHHTSRAGRNSLFQPLPWQDSLFL